MSASRELANAIRVLSMDAVRCAKSGRPAMPLAMAEGAQARRVQRVSTPSTEVFEAQDEACRECVRPRTARPRVAVQAGATLSWRRDVGAAGAVVGIDRFGAAGQAPARWYGFDSPPGASGAGAV
ncbi:protein containing Transketolase, partial [mine drainage metagenome]